MNSRLTMNTSYIPDTLAEFLYDYNGAWKNAEKKEEVRWTAPSNEDKHPIWPSQVFLYPSLSVVEDSYLNVNSKQHKIGSPKFEEHNEHTNNMNIIEPAPKSFGKLNGYNKDTIKDLFLSCAQDGERVSRRHNCRPFFKKIDSLCDRIKQDLIHHDSVVPHVNAQGTEWAIKDLVFVSTRIINGWHITKGYVYDSSEGLNKIRSTLSSQFVSVFIAWQEATHKFIGSLMISFLSLDILVQTSNNSLRRLEFFKKLSIFLQSLKNCKKTPNSELDRNKSWEQCGCEHCNMIIASKPTHHALLELSVICTEYGEKVAYNYTGRPYFKKVDNLCQRTRIELINGDGALPNLNSQGTVWAIKELIFASTRIISAWNITKGYVYNSSENLHKVQMGLSSDFVSNFTAWQEATKDLVEQLRLSFLRLDNLATTENTNLKKAIVSKPIKVFKDHLQQMKSAEVFLRVNFCQNYFPDFIAKTPDFKDIRWIIKNCLNNSYNHINEVVHDVKHTIYQVKKYLMSNIDPNLDRAVICFEADVEKVLSQKIFKDYHFGHIEGRPNEMLFVYH